MSKPPYKPAETETSYRIRISFEYFFGRPKEERIDVMVKAKLITPAQGELAKANWAKLQRANQSLSLLMANAVDGVKVEN